MTTALKRLASAFWGESQISAEYRRSLHIFRSHRATDVGSNRTQVPMRNDGIRPAFACLKIVILETVNMLARSPAVNARPIRSIRSGSDIGSAVLSWGLHECIYLLCGFASAAGAAYCCWTCGSSPIITCQASASTEGIAPVLISTVFDF